MSRNHSSQSRRTISSEVVLLREGEIMRSIDNEFYRSQAWEQTRRAYMKSQSGLCERCKARGRFEPARIVHHKIYLTPENQNDPDIAYGFDNLEALCQDCHNKEHFGDETGRRYEVGRDGKLKIL